MERVTHVIWDWNGTLLDDAWLCVEVMNEVLGRRGLPVVSADQYARLFRFPVRAYYQDIGFDFEEESFEVVGTEFIDGYAAREAACGLREQAREVLQTLAARGFTQSVLSASQQTRLTAQLQRLDVHAHFTAAVGLDDHYAAGKVDVGREWLARSGLTPAHVVLVGDTDHDVEVAQALGVACLLIPSGHQAPHRLASTGATVVENLEALLEMPGLSKKSQKIRANRGDSGTP